MIKLYTIGFTQKSAETFFGILQKNGVNKVLDIRLNNVTQLAGFTKGVDLDYFLKTISGIDYEHNTDLAPSQKLLKDHREGSISWKDYEREYIGLLNDRDIILKIDIESLNGVCFLCSEHLPSTCHRRLLAEYIQHSNDNIEIIHL